jgi:hypothetical protein
MALMTQIISVGRDWIPKQSLARDFFAILFVSTAIARWLHNPDRNLASSENAVSFAHYARTLPHPISISEPLSRMEESAIKNLHWLVAQIRESKARPEEI